MELECVESLAPDSLSFPIPDNDPDNDPQLPSKSSPFPIPYLPCPPTSSPLTRSPTPSPKRRRLSRPPPSLLLQPVRPSRHPLATLADRDLRYVVPSADHLDGTSVTPAMREEVVAWCGDMVADLKLPEGIVATAVNLFDRFIAEQSVCKTVLYALTASCLLLACKLVLDDELPHEEISSRSRVPMDDIHVMETVILNVLGWRVNVVTPHEVVNEIITHSPGKNAADRLRPLQDSLMLNALLDYRLAGFRATSVGVACYILSDHVAEGRAHGNHAAHEVYELAGRCGVSLSEVDVCIMRLREGMGSLFEDIEEVDSDEEDDIRLPENNREHNY